MNIKAVVQFQATVIGMCNGGNICIFVHVYMCAYMHVYKCVYMKTYMYAYIYNMYEDFHIFH
jgi:poly(3-hydroxyalkanoate) synthetase